MTWPYIITVPLLKDIQTQAPQAICELKTTNASTNLLVNSDAAPIDNADLRRAMALAFDRKPFIDILSDGQGQKRRRNAAAARRLAGNAAGASGDIAGLWPRRAEKSASVIRFSYWSRTLVKNRRSEFRQEPDARRANTPSSPAGSKTTSMRR
jgi:ABC-type transport system substrate-binding protein